MSTPYPKAKTTVISVQEITHAILESAKNPNKSLAFNCILERIDLVHDMHPFFECDPQPWRDAIHNFATALASLETYITSFKKITFPEATLHRWDRCHPDLNIGLLVERSPLLQAQYGTFALVDSRNVSISEFSSALERFKDKNVYRSGSNQLTILPGPTQWTAEKWWCLAEWHYGTETIRTFRSIVEAVGTPTSIPLLHQTFEQFIAAQSTKVIHYDIPLVHEQ